MVSSSYDDIVVGAGSAGAALAARLSEEPGRRVLLLEAGPDYGTVAEVPAELIARTAGDASIDHAWKFKAEVTPGRLIEYPAGKVTGGSSAVNSGVALRGAPADYDGWAAMGNPGWGWRDVLPFFRRLETDHDFDDDFHGRDGPLPIRRAGKEQLLHVHRALLDAALALGYPEAPDLNRPGATGVGPWPMNVSDGRRISTALAYLTPEVRRRTNLEIRPQTTVSRVCLAGRTVTGVDTDDRSGARFVGGGHVTLCAGAICTPGILMRSGIGASERVRAVGAEPVVGRAGVGENLMDHAFTWLSAIPEPGVCDIEMRSVQVGVRFTAAGSDEPDDMQLLAIIPVDLSGSPALAKRVGAERIFMIGAGLQRPRARGRVIWPRGGALIQPHIQLALTSERHDLERLADGLRLAWRIAHSDAMAPYLRRVALLDERALNDDALVAAYVREHVITFKHPAGTARMGPESDPSAVVDAECRVHGVEGLRVADASVMPAIPRANTNLTCIMIGERVADLRRGRGEAPRAPSRR